MEVLAMNKWLALGLAALVLVLAALPALAESNSSKLAELEALYEELALIKERIANIRAEMGLITPEQKNMIKERINEQQEWIREHNFQAPACGLGPRRQRCQDCGPGGWGHWGQQ
jgi:hypothetical protein